MNAEQFFDLERMIRYLRDLERRVERLELEMDQKTNERVEE